MGIQTDHSLLTLSSDIYFHYFKLAILASSVAIEQEVLLILPLIIIQFF